MFFFFQAEDGIRDLIVTGVQTCALPIYIAEYGVLDPPTLGLNQSLDEHSLVPSPIGSRCQEFHPKRFRLCTDQGLGKGVGSTAVGRFLEHGDERSHGEPLLYREVQCEARVLSTAPGTKCPANGAHAALPLTPASSKVATSVSRAIAERTTGSASAAPVPSPRRMSRFSSASTPRCASSVRWACSAEQWANTQ